MQPLTAKTVRAYEAHQTARMQELEGLELASFWQRALAFAIDFMLAGAVFLAGMFTLIKLLPMSWLEGRGDIHLELDFLHNWYSIVYLVAFVGLSQYFGNDRTIGRLQLLFGLTDLKFVLILCVQFGKSISDSASSILGVVVITTSDKLATKQHSRLAKGVANDEAAVSEPEHQHQRAIVVFVDDL